MSNRINVNEADFVALEDKVVVLTGTRISTNSAIAQLKIQKAVQTVLAPRPSDTLPMLAQMSSSVITTAKLEKPW